MVGGSSNALFLGLGLTILFHQCVSRRLTGILSLSSDVFDKIVSNQDVALVKFDDSFFIDIDDDRGIGFKTPERNDVLAKVAKMSMTQPDLLVAEVSVTEIPQRRNWDLADRFNIKKEDWPAFRLFLKGQQEPIVYTGNVEDPEEIMKFIIDTAGIWLGFPGCLKHFDNLVTEFLHAKGDDRNAVIRKAEEAAKSLTEKEDMESAETYIKTMKTIKEKGDDYINEEKKRVELLKEGKLSEKKKEYLGKKIGVLSSFNFRIKYEL